MERRRLFLFFALSLAIMIGWTQFVIPLLDPPAKPPDDPPAEVVDDAAGDDAAGDDAQPADDTESVADGPVVAPVPGEQPPENGEPEEVVKQPAAVNQPEKLKTFPPQQVVLGSPDPQTGYFAAVGTTSTGAALDAFTLNDPRYKSLDDPPAPGQPRAPLDIVKAVTVDGRTIRTLETAVPQIDAQLKKHNVSLADVDWKVLETVKDSTDPQINSGVTYSYVAPDGTLEIRKKYSLQRIEFGDRNPRDVRNTETQGYELKFDVTIINRNDKPQPAGYVMQGPVGVPLENIEHTSIYRSVQDGRLDPAEKALPAAERDVEKVTVTAADVVEQVNENDVANWKNPFRYIGVDVQYFAALIVPQADQLQNPYISLAQPMLVDEMSDDNHSDVSVTLTSSELQLKPTGQPGSEVTHSYTLYGGPKRDALLEPIGAADIIDYGIFSFVSKAMLAVMNFLHDALYLPYGIAIICLTMMVRGCMYPISRKQAAGAKKMKELQPKIAELKKKYENDKEKFARAQMELFSKHNYNPLAGCLPIVLQLPIFIGLYQALRNAVDLRLTGFPLTWIDNLAAPDALFRMPFALPFGLGHDFNLLPLLTVALFVIQQKLFMPPPADEQQALQHKMMNFMMIFMGFMFYHVPAGLCVYFIASSLWGIGERKMLDYGKSAGDAENKTDEAAPEAPAQQKKAKPAADEPPARKGFMQKLFEAADAAAQASQKESHSNGSNNQNGGSGKKRKKSRK